MGCNMFDLDLDGVWDELCKQLVGEPKPEKSALELLGDIQDVVKKSNERNYGDGERKF